MQGRKHSPDQIIRKLRRAEVELAEGAMGEQVYRSLEVTKQFYYRWRQSQEHWYNTWDQSTPRSLAPIPCGAPSPSRE